MDNVATFKTTRDKSKALVVVEGMDPEEALKMHTRIKKKGKGAIRDFIHAETPYKNYSGYYYQMKKLGVMPMNPRGSSKTKVSYPISKSLEHRIQQLEAELQSLSVSAGQRAAKIAAAAYEQLNYKSRKFIGDMIAKDLPAHRLSYKQEAWLSSLEHSFGV